MGQQLVLSASFQLSKLVPTCPTILDSVQQEMIEVMMVIAGTKTCKATVLSPPAYQHSAFYGPDALRVTQPTVSKVLNATQNSV